MGHSLGGDAKHRGFKFVDLLVPAILVIVAIILCAQMPSSTIGDSDISASTVKRTALPKGSVSETAYYSDNLNWISDSSTLTSGLRKFYQYTGVQPFLYLTDNIDGNTQPNDTDVQTFAEGLYPELFTDQSHLLVIFFASNGYYNTWYYTGTDAKNVVDSQATQILTDYIDKYHAYGTMASEKFLSTAFDSTARRIMDVQTSPIVYAAILISSFILSIGYLWWMAFKQPSSKVAVLTAAEADDEDEDEDDEDEDEDDENDED